MRVMPHRIPHGGLARKVNSCICSPLWPTGEAVKKDEQMHMLRARFPESVVNYLSARVKDNDRSMNAELLNILKKAMKAEPIPQATMPEARRKLTDENGEAA